MILGLNSRMATVCCWLEKGLYKLIFEHFFFSFLPECPNQLTSPIDVTCLALLIFGFEAPGRIHRVKEEQVQ